MQVGLIGFARSGKTTVFNALTGSQATVGAFGSRDANLAVLKVPDVRLDRLAVVYSPHKVTHAEFSFIDVAPSASSTDNKALDDAALNLLKNVDALVHVIRAFADEAVLHPAGSVDPVRDCAALETELQLSDLIIIEKRLERMAKEHRTGHEHELLERCRDHIESGAPLRTLDLTEQDVKELAGFGFLSQKPLLLLGNYGEEAIGQPDPSGLETYAQERGQSLISFCGAMETELAQLPEEERRTFRAELGLGEESRRMFIRAAYAMLGLVSFFTVTGPEVRAWTVGRNTKAVDAASVVHTDMARGFIRAEVVAYEDFIAAGSMAKAKDQGVVRLEGKDYLVQDGDIILFRFNV